MAPMSDHDTWNMFAAAALAGLPDHMKVLQTDHRIKISDWAAGLADALLAESKKRETPDKPNLLETLEMFGMDDRAYVVGNEIRIPFDNHEDACRVVFKARTDLVAYRIVSEAGVTK